jgi:hypothetical protein
LRKTRFSVPAELDGYIDRLGDFCVMQQQGFPIAKTASWACACPGMLTKNRAAGPEGELIPGKTSLDNLPEIGSTWRGAPFMDCMSRSSFLSADCTGIIPTV